MIRDQLVSLKLIIILLSLALFGHYINCILVLICRISNKKEIIYHVIDILVIVVGCAAFLGFYSVWLPFP